MPQIPHDPHPLVPGRLIRRRGRLDPRALVLQSLHPVRGRALQQRGLGLRIRHRRSRDRVRLHIREHTRPQRGRGLRQLPDPPGGLHRGPRPTPPSTVTSPPTTRSHPETGHPPSTRPSPPPAPTPTSAPPKPTAPAPRTAPPTASHPRPPAPPDPASPTTRATNRSTHPRSRTRHHPQTHRDHEHRKGEEQVKRRTGEAGSPITLHEHTFVSRHFRSELVEARATRPSGAGRRRRSETDEVQGGELARSTLAIPATPARPNAVGTSGMAATRPSASEPMSRAASAVGNRNVPVQVSPVQRLRTTIPCSGWLAIAQSAKTRTLVVEPRALAVEDPLLRHPHIVTRNSVAWPGTSAAAGRSAASGRVSR